jgi:glycosyltransferase involved in cell wall biosynthesis
MTYIQRGGHLGKSKKCELIFVSPHLKAIGETYVLPRLALEAAERDDISVLLFDVCGEWTFAKVDEKFVIKNPLAWIVKLAPNLERISPWWNYRVWLTFVTLSVAFGLPAALFRKKRDAGSVVVGRMATTGVAIAARMTSRRHRFVASMAGVPLPSALRQLSWPVLYRSFSHVVIPVDEMRDSVSKVTKKAAHDLEHIPNAVLDLKLNIPKFDATYRTPQDREREFKILLVGRLTRQKGVDLAIKAMAHLPDTFSLYLIGAGEDKAALYALAVREKVANRVIFKGFDPRPWDETSDYDVFIMPSRWEGPGHTIIEALALGMPSIVANCPYGPAETVKHGKFGMVVDVNCHISLAEGIKNVAKNHAEFVNRAKNAAEESSQYTAPQILNRWKNLVG